MKIKQKLLIPSVTQALLIAALLAYILIAGSSLMDNLQMQTHQLKDSTNEYKNLVELADRFLLGKATVQEYSESSQALIDNLNKQLAFDAKELISALNEINESIAKIEKMKAQNEANVKQIMKLTNTSMGYSNLFIRETVSKLADPKQRQQISNLQIMVIIGANTNTVSNLKIQSLIFQMMQDLSRKDDVLKFLKMLLSNVEKDIEALRNTEFVDMALKAKKANTTVESLTLRIIQDSETIRQTEKDIHDRMHQQNQYLEKVQTEGVQAALSEIENLGILLTVFLVLISALLLGIGYMIARMIIKTAHRAEIQYRHNSGKR